MANKNIKSIESLLNRMLLAVQVIFKGETDAFLSVFKKTMELEF